MHIDTVELVCRETYATHKPGVGFLAPDDASGIFDPITEDQMYARIMRRFRAVSAKLADEMAPWPINPTKLKGDNLTDWINLVATPEQLLVFWPWKKAQPLQDSRVVRSGLEAIRGVAFTGDDLDADPMVIGTPSGVMDLSTGRLLDPLEAVERLVTKRTAVDPAPPGDRNEEFLAAITSAIPAGHVEYLRWHLARGLVAEMSKEAFVHVGSGANGKSMILGLVHVALGDYSVQVDSAALTGNTPDYHKALLRGARMCYMEELEAEVAVVAAVWKMLAATPTITARPIREAPITFPATWTVHICSNTMPSIDTNDGGAERRARIVTWPHKYVKDPREAHERPINIRDVAVWGSDPRNQASMLRWLMDVVNDPPPPVPGSLADEKAEWSAENNKVGTFVTEMCIMGPDEAVSLQRLQEQYETWLHLNGFMKPNRFTREKAITAWAANERGITRVRLSTGKVFKGLRLRVDDTFDWRPPAERRPASTVAPVELIRLFDGWPTDEPG